MWKRIKAALYNLKNYLSPSFFCKLFLKFLKLIKICHQSIITLERKQHGTRDLQNLKAAIPGIFLGPVLQSLFIWPRRF